MTFNSRRLAEALKSNRFAYTVLKPLVLSVRLAAAGIQHVVHSIVKSRTLAATKRLAHATRDVFGFSVAYFEWIARGRAGIGSSARGNLIVMLVVSDLRRDPRVEREARALVRAGYRVVVICPDMLPTVLSDYGLNWGEGIQFEILPARDALFAYRWPRVMAYGLFRAAIRHSAFAFHAHDLNSALAGLMAGLTTGSYVVCDFHEWYSENIEFDEESKEYRPVSGSQKRLFQALEKVSLKNASATITVCDSIADEMAQMVTPNRRPVVVRNIPPLSTEGVGKYNLKSELGLSRDEFVVLYQGGVGPSRLLEPIIEALTHLPGWILVIRGQYLEYFGEAYLELARRLGVESRLFLLPPVLSRDVVAAANGADVGIWNLPAWGKNFTYALPNKIFEYMAAGLPVLAAHHPEAARLVETNKIGLTFDPYNADEIAASISRLMTDPELISSCRTNTSIALARLSADEEWYKVVSIYNAMPRQTG